MRGVARVSACLLSLLLSSTASYSQGEPLGRSAAFGPLDSGSTVTVAAGTPLRSRPDPRASLLITIDMTVELQILERQGDWVRATFGDRTGWLAPGGEPEATAPVLPVSRQHELVLDTSPVERAAKVASARALLAGENPDITTLGPWPLHTDVREAPLLALLDRVASGLPATYSARFGLAPPLLAEPLPIVLFAAEANYRAFTAEFTDIAGLHGGGHADSAMAALFVGDATDSQVAATLIHELTHLLNRATFEEAPATWLEEGMANDLGFTRLDSGGGLRVGTLGGESSVSSQRTFDRRVIVNTLQTGGQAMLAQLLRDWSAQRSKLTPLGRLLDLSWSEFVEGSRRTSHYALSTFFVRYLLDSSAADRTSAFQSFVAAAAGGQPSGAVALAQALGTSVAALEHDYERWLTVQSVSVR